MAHRKLLFLLCLMLAVVTGTLVVASSLADAVALPAPAATEALDRVVPGMTRADDLAGLGFGTPAILSGFDAAARLPQHIDRSVDACLAAGAYCNGYLFPLAGGDHAVLLVMDGRVIFKGLAV